MEWEGSSPYSPEFKSRFSFHLSLSLAPSRVLISRRFQCHFVPKKKLWIYRTLFSCWSRQVIAPDRFMNSHIFVGDECWWRILWRIVGGDCRCKIRYLRYQIWRLNTSITNQIPDTMILSPTSLIDHNQRVIKPALSSTSRLPDSPLKSSFSRESFFFLFFIAW